MTMGDRIAILNDGRLQQVGTPLECYHQPANLFVAGFMGEPSMNFFEVELQGTQLTGEHFEYPVSDGLKDDLGGTTELTLGVRPEDIELVQSASGSHDFETTVDVVEPLGDENNVYLQFDGADADAETFVAAIDGLQRVESGQPVVARIPEESVHVFDRATGEALHSRSLAAVDEAEVDL
jgi:multiple sugar transport system ATP-binding protein